MRTNLTSRLTGAASVSRVQTLQTIRTSRSLAGVPAVTGPGPARGHPMMFPLLMLLTAVRLLVAATTPLSPDEAYYWVWSRLWRPGIPTIRRWWRFGSGPAPGWPGDGPLGVRLLAPWAAAIGSVLLARTGALLLR